MCPLSPVFESYQNDGTHDSTPFRTQNARSRQKNVKAIFEEEHAAVKGSQYEDARS